MAKAVEAGARAVICASTGNTSASAAAYAAQCGLECLRLRAPRDASRWASSPRPSPTAPESSLSTATSTTPCAWRARSATSTRSPWSTRSTRTASRARRRPPSRSCDDLGEAPGRTSSSPSATPATSPPTGRGFQEYAERGKPARLPLMMGFQAAGAAPIVSGRSSRTRRPSPPPSASATPPAGSSPSPPATSPAAPSTAVTDDEILAAYQPPGARRGHLLRARLGRLAWPA